MEDPLFPFTISPAPVYESQVSSGDWYRLVLLDRGTLGFSTRDDRPQFLGSCVLMYHPDSAQIVRKPSTPSYQEIRFSEAFIEEIDIRCWDDRFLQSVQNVRDQGTIVHVPLHLAELERISRLFQELLDECANGKDGYRTVVRLKVIELMVLIFRGSHQEAAQEREQRAAWAIDEIIQHIQDNYADDFSLEDLALKCGLNRSYFSRAFKNATGVPLFEYINRIRIQKACLLLKRGNMQIIEIAYAVGYKNLSFFYRYFNRIMRMPPREYRTMAQK